MTQKSTRHLQQHLFVSFIVLSLTFLILAFSSSALAQDYNDIYTGTYVGTGINDNFTLHLEFDGTIYTGTLGFGMEAVPLEGYLDGSDLVGSFDASETQDGYFIATKEGNQLLLYYGWSDSDGTFNESSVRELLFVEVPAEAPGEITPSTPAENPLANPAGTNPLAASLSVTRLAGETIQPNNLYNAGTRLKSDLVGLSFSVPATGQAAYTLEQGLVFGSTTLSGGGVQLIALSSGDLNAVVSSLLTIDPETEQLVLVNKTVQTATELRAGFQYASAEGTAYKELWAQQGSGGQVVVLIGTAFPAESAATSALLTDIGNSFQFASPDLGSVAGLAANVSGVNFSKTTGGAGGEGVVSAANFALDLCSSREYRKFEESVFSVTAEFDDNSSNAFSNSKEESYGTWDIGAHLTGAAILLSEQNGGFDYMEILEANGNLFLNNKPVQASVSGLCQ